MRKSQLLEFESAAFPVFPGEDHSTNPGIFGKALAEWLAQQLRVEGFVPSRVVAEDFGWCVPLESKPHKLYVACASADGEPNNWRVFVFAEVRFVSRLLGEDKSAESLSAAFVAVKNALESSPQVQGLRVEPT